MHFPSTLRMKISSTVRSPSFARQSYRSTNRHVYRNFSFPLHSDTTRIFVLASPLLPGSCLSRTGHMALGLKGLILFQVTPVHAVWHPHGKMFIIRGSQTMTHGPRGNPCISTGGLFHQKYFQNKTKTLATLVIMLKFALMVQKQRGKTARQQRSRERCQTYQCCCILHS